MLVSHLDDYKPHQSPCLLYGWIMSPKTHVYVEPVNVISFGNRVFAAKTRSYLIKRTLTQYDLGRGERREVQPAFSCSSCPRQVCEAMLPAGCSYMSDSS